MKKKEKLIKTNNKTYFNKLLRINLIPMIISTIVGVFLMAISNGDPIMALLGLGWLILTISVLPVYLVIRNLILAIVHKRKLFFYNFFLMLFATIIPIISTYFTWRFTTEARYDSEAILWTIAEIEFAWAIILVGSVISSIILPVVLRKRS